MLSYDLLVFASITTNLLRSLGHQNLLRFNPETQVRLRHLGATLFEVGVEGHEACLVHEHGPQCGDGVLQPHDLREREDCTVVVVSLGHAAENSSINAQGGRGRVSVDQICPRTSLPYYSNPSFFGVGRRSNNKFKAIKKILMGFNVLSRRRTILPTNETIVLLCTRAK